MSLVVVGSIALDTVKTPHGERKDALGGSATYFSFAAQLFSPVRLVGVVGEDFPDDHLELLRSQKFDLTDLQIASGKTFRWTGAYDGDMSVAKTLDTQLNVFSEFNPQISEKTAAARFLFLANIHPSLQRKVRAQIPNAEIVFCDTMNLWIETEPEELKGLLNEVSGIIINDQEAKNFTGETNLIKAGKAILKLGPKWVVVKKGEHGAVLFGKDEIYAHPAYPLEHVTDPTGAGDSFAGAFMGYLTQMEDEYTTANLKKAVAYGIVVSSFCCEAFSLDRLKELSLEEVNARMEAYKTIIGI